MREPIIQADESLVLNGDFSRSLTGWAVGPLNPEWLGVESDNYEGFQIRFLGAGNLSSASQVITAPKDLGVEARYVLRFLCETRHHLSGRVVISIDEQTAEQVILLPPGPARNIGEDQARLANGQPLVFLPREYEVPLTLPLKSRDRVRVSVFSPANAASDFYSRICITRIHLALHLPPVVLQTFKLDEEFLPSTRTLYLCLGATDIFSHQFSCVVAPGSAWEGTKAALINDNNPLGSIVPTPDWGIPHSLDSPRRLDCPWIGDEGPHLFRMQLVNQYTAEPFSIEVSLGHHRLVFRDSLEAAYYPVLELKQNVRLGVQVASFYTGEALDGRTVTWSVAGQVGKTSVITDTSGWAYFDYVPTAAGDFSLEASVDSPYYAAGVTTLKLPVRVLATDPWKEVLAVVDGSETPWAEKTGYPNRGTSYPVHLRLPAGSPLAGTELWLRWSGDAPEQLGVVVSPTLEVPVPVNDLQALWTLASEDRRDGRFKLTLGCSRLLLPSQEKTMSLARNVVRIGEVHEANKSPVVDEKESVLLRVQVVHQVVNGEGDPAVNALVEWITPEGPLPVSVTGTGGWAGLLYKPTSAGNKSIIVRVRAHEDALPVEHTFVVAAVQTSPWKTEVRILLDGVEVDREVLGLLCWRGQSHILKVEPVPGSSLIGKNIALNWRAGTPGIGLSISSLGVARPLLSGGLSWTLNSQVTTSKSSLFELKLTSAALTSDRELFGRLIAASLAEEFSLMLDQSPAALGSGPLFPCLGALHRLSALPNALSPLVGLSVRWLWTGTPAEELGATVKPAPDIWQLIDDGGAHWALDFTASQNPGSFDLTLQLPELALSAAANQMFLGHNKVRIQAWREASVDPVVGQDPVWMQVRVFSHFTGRAVAQRPVGWRVGDDLCEVPTDAEGWSRFAHAPKVAGEVAVEARVASPYDAYEDKRSMTSTALARDPWQDVQIRFDDQPAEPWGQKTWFPRRNGHHVFEVTAPDDSPLFGGDLTLGMTGTGPAELGIKFSMSNVLGTPRPFYSVGLRYEFFVNDVKNGSFALRLAASRLARLSPANAMSLGSSIPVAKILDGHRAVQILDWQESFSQQVSVVSTISGKPLATVPVTWRSADLGVQTTLTNFYGVARIDLAPTTPGAAVLTASVGEGDCSDLVSIPFILNEARKILTLEESGALGSEAQDVLVQATVVSVNTGKPVVDVDVMWEYDGVTLPPTLTDVNGKAKVSVTREATGKKVLRAVTRGGENGWDEKVLVIRPISVHASFKRIYATPSSVHAGQSVVMSAEIVATVTGQPLEGREVFVKLNNREFESSQTDANGEVSRQTSGLVQGQRLSLDVELRNPSEPPSVARLALLVLL